MHKLKTALYHAHLNHRAKLFTFCDWLMPLHYGSAMREHHMVRTDAGMFDLSCMTIIDVKGLDAKPFMRYLLSGDVERLQHSGQAMYSCMLNEQGGIVDDLVVYAITPHLYRLLFNTATFEHTLMAMHNAAKSYDVSIEHQPVALLSVNGPTAIANTQQVLNAEQISAIDLLQTHYGQFVGDDNFFVAKQERLGEPGLLIAGTAEEIETIWHNLLIQRVQPCGLLAFDTLRIEAGVKQFSHEFDNDTTPLDVNLLVVDFEPGSRNFIGRDALQQQQQLKQNPMRLVGLVLKENSVIAAGQRVETNAGEGVVTSGCFSPTLSESIAIARVPAAAKSEVSVDVRGKMVAATLHTLPFVNYGNILTGEYYVGYTE